MTVARATPEERETLADLPLPQPPTGRTLDPAKVKVTYPTNGLAGPPLPQHLRSSDTAVDERGRRRRRVKREVLVAGRC